MNQGGTIPKVGKHFGPRGRTPSYAVVQRVGVGAIGLASTGERCRDLRSRGIPQLVVEAQTPGVDGDDPAVDLERGALQLLALVSRVERRQVVLTGDDAFDALARQVEDLEQPRRRR